MVERAAWDTPEITHGESSALDQPQVCKETALRGWRALLSQPGRRVNRSTRLGVPFRGTGRVGPCTLNLSRKMRSSSLAMYAAPLSKHLWQIMTLRRDASDVLTCGVVLFRVVFLVQTPFRRILCTAVGRSDGNCNTPTRL